MNTTVHTFSLSLFLTWRELLKHRRGSSQHERKSISIAAAAACRFLARSLDISFFYYTRLSTMRKWWWNLIFASRFQLTTRSLPLISSLVVYLHNPNHHRSENLSKNDEWEKTMALPLLSEPKWVIFDRVSQRERRNTSSRSHFLLRRSQSWKENIRHVR